MTWNPSDKYVDITLSGGNLTATLDASTNKIVRANTTASSGYFEVNFSSLITNLSSKSSVGLSNTSELVGNYLGITTNGVGYILDGHIICNDTFVASGLATWGVGDVIGVELTTTPSIKFYKNGTLVYTYTGTMPTGSLFPSVCFGNATDSETANFGASAMSYLPAGVTSWDGSQTGVAGSVGSSAGTDTVTGVGAWLQSGAGSSAGTDTATATGAWLQAGTGSSAGDDTASATAAPIQAKVGSSAGANTTTATGAWLQSGAGSSTGDNTASATAAPIQAKVGSSAGSNTTTATASWLQSGAGSSAGTDTAAATGAWSQTGVGSAAGSDTATGTGAWLQSGVGNATGDNTTAGYYEAPAATGTSSGTNTATAVGAWIQASVGSAAGTDTAAAVGTWTQAGAGSATGSDAAAATGGWTQPGIGSVTGTDVATAIGSWLQSGVGSSAGTNTTSGIPVAITYAGTATGSNTATAVGAWLQSGVGSAAGANITTAYGVVLNPSDTSADITLSNGNLTATRTDTTIGSTDVLSRATTGRTAGGYFEITFSNIVGGTHNPGIGLVNLSASLNDYPGHTANGIGYFADGYHQGPGSGSGIGPTFAAGDVIGCELLTTTAKFYKNGVLVFTETTLPSGTLYPVISVASVNDAGTINFGASHMSYLPTGTVSWDGLQTGAFVGTAAGSNTATAVGHWLQSGAGSSVGANTATGSVVGGIAWNPSDKSVDVTLSNLNLTATRSGTSTGANDVQARANSGRTSGGYFELTFSTIVGGAHNPGIGLGNLSQLVNDYPGHTANSIGYFANGYYQGPTGAGTGPTFAVGDVIGCELTATSAKFYKNGTLVFTESSLPAGTLYPIISVASVTDSGTANFGASAMSFLPTGVVSWDGSRTGGVFYTGSAAGSNTATAVGRRIQTGTGSAAGGNVASGATSQADFSTDFDQSFAGFPGAETGLGTGDFNSDFSNDFPVFHVGVVASGAGTSAGANIAAAVGAAGFQNLTYFNDDFDDDFFILLESLVVSAVGFAVGGNIAAAVGAEITIAGAQVWSPTTEYTRVLAPVATRTYKTGTDLRRAAPLGMTRTTRTGTELKRSPPQGMKRRYG